MNTSRHVLTQAIRERLSATARVRGAEADTVMQVRFLAEGNESGDEGFWVELLKGDLARVDRLIAAETPIQVSFQSGQARLSFVTTIQGRRHAFLRGERLLMAYPATVQVPERRRGKRQRTSERVELSAWLQMPGEQRRFMVFVWDLSPTGAGFVLPPESKLKLTAGQPLTVYMVFDGVEHRVESRYRNTVQTPGEGVRIGVEFDLSGPKASEVAGWVEPLIGRLQGVEARRALVQVLGSQATLHSDLIESE